jgi:hypothetical protein
VVLGTSVFPKVVVLDVAHRAGRAGRAGRAILLFGHEGFVAVAAHEEVIVDFELILHPNPAVLAAVTFPVVGVEVGEDMAVWVLL